MDLDIDSLEWKPFSKEDDDDLKTKNTKKSKKENYSESAKNKKQNDPWLKVYHREKYEFPDPYIKDKDPYTLDFFEKQQETVLHVSESFLDINKILTGEESRVLRPLRKIL